ncbi:hypothetical protein ALP36_102143 [Pseudomonas syringae pv. coriandricola]|uniref:Uncharacterized protein n=1 Tax=Pseudomonas syringae pv. coriandricola TaxID=264453 RepID=A0A3M4TY40_9PSED|nr:hypothetical protein ALP87_102067 [Pseudomonas syringae pv. coriandricola]RMU11152.1 hypothetical protein ALP36_102143 [Pseudomonas syringae pv. coriandricola]
MYRQESVFEGTFLARVFLKKSLWLKGCPLVARRAVKHAYNLIHRRHEYDLPVNWAAPSTTAR